MTRNRTDTARILPLPGPAGILQVLLIAALLQEGGCRDREPQGDPAKADVPENGTEHKAGSAADGKAAVEPARLWADLLADPQTIEIGLAKGGRFVDLGHPSGLWALADAREAAGLETEAEGGVRLGKKPLILRLSEKDAAACRVLLALESERECTLTVKTGAKAARTSPLGPGPSAVPVKLPAAAAAGEVDIEVGARTKPGPGSPMLKGFWLWNSDGDPPLPPARPPSCGKNDRGLQLDPGMMLVATTALPGNPVIRASASGPGRTGLVLEVEQDQAGTMTLTMESAPEEPSGTRVMDRPLSKGPWSPAEIRVLLDPGAAGPACIERLEIAAPDAQAADSRKPYEGVVLVMTDTMRGDLFPWHEGYRTPAMTVSMPGLQALAEKSHRFVMATSHASYTKPSVATMLTGLYPSEHGALGRKHAVHAAVSLITEKLEDAGVHTAGILSNYFFNPRFGLRKGWTDAQWTDPFKASIDDALVLDALESYLDAETLPSPFFLYIHLSGAHAPYAPPQEARENIAARLLSPSVDPVKTTQVVKAYQSGRIGKIKKELLGDLIGLYRADAWYHDSIMTRLVDILQEKGVMKRAVLIYTSDHGEEFFEHGGLGHGRSLWSEQVDVPLMLHLPGQTEGAAIHTLAGHVDIAPTVFDCLGLAKSGALPGVSLLELASGGGAPPEGGARGLLVQHWAGGHGVRAGEFKLLHLPGSGDSLTVLKGGAEEHAPAGEFPIALRLLHKKEVALLKSILDRTRLLDLREEAKEAELDEETRKQLEELGYILD